METLKNVLYLYDHDMVDRNTTRAVITTIARREELTIKDLHRALVERKARLRRS